MSSNYPSPVTERAENMISQLEEVLEETEELEASELRESFQKRLFQRFIAGEDLVLGKQEIEDSIDEASLNTVYNSLVKKGFLNFYQDEEGEKHYFLTEKGTSVAEELIKKNNDGRIL